MSQENANKPKSIYREKSLERISSPEQLNSYICVVNVGIWVVLGAIIALLVGGIIWGAVITLDSEVVPAAATVKNEEACIYFSADDKSNVREGMTIHIGDADYIMPEAEINGVKLYKETDSAVMDILETDGDNYVYYVRFLVDLPNGVYNAEIVSNEISPFELLFN